MACWREGVHRIAQPRLSVLSVFCSGGVVPGGRSSVHSSQLDSLVSDSPAQLAQRGNKASGLPADEECKAISARVQVRTA